MSEAPHIPVMLDEVLASLQPVDGGVYVDGTFGAGGYTTGILEAADCTVLAIDQDETALERGQALKDKYGDRLILAHGNFAQAQDLCADAGFASVDGFVLDLGVSSMQLDEAERGFSFRFDGPLDMRMDQRGGGETAADIVNTYDEGELANIIYQYGEERHSRKIARAIVKKRHDAPFTRTLELADLVRSVVPRSPKDKIDPATRTFQGLRIYVNRELDVLRDVLTAAERILHDGGRLVIVSFHSLEDSLVKHFLMERAGRKGGGSRHLPVTDMHQEPTFRLPSTKAIFPTDTESSSNPRSRSARLRVAVRTDAPAWNPAKTAGGRQ